jgi:hypothetical protein
VNKKKLYIIGNGFDLHHGIPSAYSNFRDYVESNDNELYDELNTYFNPDDLWSDFEGTLEYLDTDEIVDRAMNFFESYSHPKWSESMHHDYQYELERGINVITVNLKQHFTDWILELEIENHKNIDLLSLDCNAKFLNFNYTNTLETLYKTPIKNIIYIHNKAIDKKSNLILGHSRNPKEIKSFNDVAGIEDQDVRITEGNTILDNYFEKTYKRSDEIIRENIQYFNELNTLEEIIVIGHSLSEVDSKYFQKIISKIDKGNTIWKVSYYGKESIPKSLKFLTDLGISEKLISFHPTAEIENGIDPNQGTLFE